MTPTEIVRECIKWNLELARLVPGFQKRDFSARDVNWILYNVEVGEVC